MLSCTGDSVAFDTAPGMPRIYALFNKAAPSNGTPSKSSSSFSPSDPIDGSGSTIFSIVYNGNFDYLKYRLFAKRTQKNE